ncbi:MAG: DNA polymerase III subunit beta [bacterium]
MKATLIQENLAKALTHINKAISNRPNIPVLANVLIETEKGRIKLSSTNLEIGINTWIGADVEIDGKLTVSARLLAEFINSLKSGKIEIEYSKQTLVVNSVDNKAEFYVIPADDFPKVPEAEGKAILKMNAIEFANIIAKTAFAAGNDESRPVLTGILFYLKDEELALVAIDGFRLSKKILKIKTKIETEVKEIVPAKALIEVEKLIRDVATDKDEIEIFYMNTKNQMLFKMKDVELTTRLIEGEFPDYEQILPKDKVLKLLISKSEFADILKVVMIFARNVIGNKAKFSIDTELNKLKLAANVVDIGNNESSVNISQVEGDNLETGFNVKFLSEMISAIESKDIEFQSNGPTAPGVFLDTKDSNYIHVIMPMRLGN